MRTTTRGLLALTAVTALALSACGGGSGSADPESPAGDADGSTTLVVGASPTPHAEILEFIAENLAADAGIELDIRTFDDYVLPNTALAEGELDANYFQHLPYFESQVAERGYDFAHFAGVHIEPYALYSESVTAVEDIPAGGTIAVTNDPGNQPRALDLLVAAGLITLTDTGDAAATLLDIADNPKDLEFVEIAPEQLVRSLQDVDAAVINGNYALEAGLNPVEDSLVIESGVDSPYANFLAVRSEDKDDPALVALDELLHSDEVKAFIQERWADGEIIPAF